MSNAYVVGHITVKNADAWSEYRSQVPATLAPWGADLSFRGRKVASLAGDLPYCDIVVIRFPSLDAVIGWFSSAAYQALAMHWDGGSWTLAPPPTPNASADAILTGVDTVGAGEAWTVGYQTNAAGVRRTLIEHATGLTWARTTSPNDGTPNNKDNTLMSVSGSTATGLWAVGCSAATCGAWAPRTEGPRATPRRPHRPGSR